MDLFTRDDLKTLVTAPKRHCVSIFMPTHRGGGEADPIRCRAHVGEAEKRLVAAGLRAPEAKELLGPAHRLVEDAPFWKNQCDGLALFLAPKFVHLYRLPLAFMDVVAVGSRFHVTPLLPLLSGNGRFYVLALSRHAVRLLQGSRYGVSEVDLKGVPRNLAAALLTHDADKPFTFYGRRGGPDSWGGIFHGHGVGLDDAKDDLLQYFHRIDRGLHPVLREERAPLVLAAVEYLQPIYRQANTYPHLLERGIKGNPDQLSGKQLHDEAWALVKPQFEKSREQAVAQYRQLAGTGRTACEVADVVPAACGGQIETLFVARDSRCWGKFDPVTGQLETHDQECPGDEDLLNLAAAHTLLHGRTVYALEPREMPDGALSAAVFCLPLAKRGKRP